MIPCDKYERGHQYLNGGHQGNFFLKKRLILILRLTQSNQWQGVDHAAQIYSLNSPPIF